MLVAVGQLLAAIAGVIPPNQAAYLITASGIVYTLARALAKFGEKNGESK